jgi:hypothetical protein
VLWSICSEKLFRLASIIMCRVSGAWLGMPLALLLLLLLVQPSPVAPTTQGKRHKWPAPGAFDPYTFDFRAQWTAYPQSAANHSTRFLATGPYALCSFANCTVLPGTSPPIAECGCAGFAEPSERNTTTGSTPNVLEAALLAGTLAACAVPSADCANNANNPSPFARAMLYGKIGSPPQRVSRMYSALPRKQGGQGSRGRRIWRAANAADAAGNLRLGWDLISAFNGGTWPNWTDPETQGSSAAGTRTCEDGGVYSMCFSVGCLKQPAFNGMPYTCYCPYYKTSGPFILPAGSGYACDGLQQDGQLKFVGSGCQFGCAIPLAPSPSPPPPP